MDWNNDLVIVDTLLEHEILYVPDNDGCMPLHYAANIGYVGYLELLPQKTQLAVVDLSGQIALELAAGAGHLQAVQFLLKWDIK
jgi:ankyrin repeat protein